MELKKILIIRFSSMGDIVLTSPVYRNLKRQFPHLKIHVLVKKQFSFIHLNNPNIDKVWETYNSGEDLLNQLVSEQFDFVADLQNNRRSNRLVRQLNRPTEKLNKLNIRKWFQVVFNLKGKNIPHVVFRYLEVFGKFNLQNDNKGLEFHFQQNTSDVDQLLPSDFKIDNYIVFVVGGAHEGKKWSNEKFQELIHLCKDEYLVLIGGKEDCFNFELYSKHFNAIGELNVFESARVLEKSKLVVTGDTGMMHIAAALRKNIISLWGCTTPSLGMSVYRGANESNNSIRTLSIQSLRTLRPCSKLGNRCKYGMNNKCIDVINSTDVYQAILNLQKEVL